MVTVPHRRMCLNTWSPLSGTLGTGYRSIRRWNLFGGSVLLKGGLVSFPVPSLLPPPISWLPVMMNPFGNPAQTTLSFLSSFWRGIYHSSRKQVNTFTNILPPFSAVFWSGQTPFITELLQVTRPRTVCKGCTLHSRWHHWKSPHHIVHIAWRQIRHRRCPQTIASSIRIHFN